MISESPSGAGKSRRLLTRLNFLHITHSTKRHYSPHFFFLTASPLPDGRRSPQGRSGPAGAEVTPSRVCITPTRRSETLLPVSILHTSSPKAVSLLVLSNQGKLIISGIETTYATVAWMRLDGMYGVVQHCQWHLQWCFFFFFQTLSKVNQEASQSVLYNQEKTN